MTVRDRLLAALEQGPHTALQLSAAVGIPQGEVADHLRAGRLVPVVRETPALPVQLTCLTQHRRLRDPKIRAFTDFIIAACRADLARAVEGLPVFA